GLRVLLHEQQGARAAREAAPAGAAGKVDHRGVVTGAAVLNPAPPSPSQSLSTPCPRATSPCVGVTYPSRHPFEPSRSRWQRTRITSPGFTSSRLTPTFVRPCGPVASSAHVVTSPLASFTSR